MANTTEMTTQKLLGELLPGLESDMAAIPVEGLAIDSRKVRPGDVFLAVRGHSLDGREFIADAVAAGAAAVIADAPCVAEDWSLPVIEIEELARRISAIAGAFYGQPSRQLSLVGITGTNGKTSCSWLLAQLLEFLGKPCGLMGTIGSGRVGDLAAGLNTTPGALMIQQQLAEWRDGGAQWAAMEVSSHGLDQYRVEALHFDAVIFTNLSRDHLDYHGDMQRYQQAKARLFSWPQLPLAVINRDDEFGRKLIAHSTAEQVIDFSLHDTAAQVYLSEIDCNAQGSRARLHSPWGEVELETGLIGEFNLANITACCAVLLAKGLSPTALTQAVAALQPVPGRMQCLRSRDGVLAVVDYAHTEDALRKALAALRPMTSGALHCVFGCGGDRDRGKRPLMGAAVAGLADRITVTSDNPRNEDPQQIVDEIVAGIADREQCQQVLDRAAAIAAAVDQAQPGDVILLAGKGHENYQQLGAQRLPFSDIDQLRLALARRQRGEPS